MAESRIHPSDLIPEADLLEQQTPLESSSLNDPLIDTESAISDSPADLADEADRLEQQAPVPASGDDYPRGPSGAGVVVTADPRVEVVVRARAHIVHHPTLPGNTSPARSSCWVNESRRPVSVVDPLPGIVLGPSWDPSQAGWVKPSVGSSGVGSALWAMVGRAAGSGRIPRPGRGLLRLLLRGASR